MAHDVFICHSSADKLTADAACAVLESKSIRCWIAPRDIQPGTDYAEAIIDAIAEVKVFLLVLSSHANDSTQVKREVERAVHRGIPIIPLRIENVAPSKVLEYFISSPHWLDAFTPPLQRHLDYLGEVIERILRGEVAAPEGPPTLAPAPPASTRFGIRRGLVAGLVAVVTAAVVGGVAWFSWPKAPAAPTSVGTPPVQAAQTAAPAAASPASATPVAAPPASATTTDPTPLFTPPPPVSAALAGPAHRLTGAWALPAYTCDEGDGVETISFDGGKIVTQLGGSPAQSAPAAPIAGGLGVVAHFPGGDDTYVVRDGDTLVFTAPNGAQLFEKHCSN